MKNVIVFGGDGFLGWPLSLRLKSQGYNVLIVDDFSRREYDNSFGMSSLVPIASPEEREAHSGIKFVNLKVDQSFKHLAELFQQFTPDAIVHFAQQRSAPISMYSPETRISTVSRNNTSTINLLELVRTTNPNIKILHMGTMGVYGYSSASVINEGYVGETKQLLPMNPGSVYHLTKCHDQLTFQLYQKLYGLDIVDLHQGIVWGSQTIDTLADEKLYNRYDYDSMYGTVFNRFMVQYLKKIPLTVYGNGNQKRAFIHISDSITSCVNALTLPKTLDKVFIANQYSELLTVSDVANTIIGCDKVKDNVGIQHVDNPRIEETSDFLAVNEKWAKVLNTVPKIIEHKNIMQEIDFIHQYITHYDESLTLPNSKW